MKTVKIYQLNNQQRRYFGFLNYDLGAELNGREVTANDYDLVYTIVLPDDVSLEDVFYLFNVNHPADFTGHSLSVSDVVEMDGSLWFCDDFSWKMLSW